MAAQAAARFEDELVSVQAVVSSIRGQSVFLNDKILLHKETYVNSVPEGQVSWNS